MIIGELPGSPFFDKGEIPMKIIEAINKIDDLKFNNFEQDRKIDWLSKLDCMVKRLIIDTHEGGNDIAFTGYDSETDTQTELLIPAPFDEAYLRWMEAQIDYHNGEIDKYNISITMFNTEFEAFASWYHRNHLPVSHGRRFIF